MIIVFLIFILNEVQEVIVLVNGEKGMKINIEWSGVCKIVEQPLYYNDGITILDTPSIST